MTPTRCRPYPRRPPRISPRYRGVPLSSRGSYPRHRSNGKAQAATHADRADTAANADALDGRDSSAFYAADSKVADSTHADRADWAADAQKLDGRHAYEFVTGVAEVRLEGEPPLIPALPEHVTYGSLSIRVPFPGYLRVNGNVTFFNDQSNIIPPDPNVVPGSGMVQGVVRRVVGDGYVDSVPSYEDLKGCQYANLALDGVFFVGEGEETVEIWLARGWEGPGLGPIYAQAGVLTAEYAFYNLSDQEPLFTLSRRWVLDSGYAGCELLRTSLLKLSEQGTSNAPTMHLAGIRGQKK